MLNVKRLAVLLALFLTTTPAYAGLINLPNFVSGNDVNIANLNLTNTTMENEFNGSIEGGVNIKPGSLVSADFAQSVSIVQFRDEAFNDFTYSGMVPATSVDLTSDISAGISYIDGIRVDKAAESHTYTASKDTYVYINAGGYYVYQEVANGAAAPSTPSNCLLLAKVVTDLNNITGVTDSRTTSIQITTTTSNFPQEYRKEAIIVKDSTTEVHAEPGQIAIGTTLYQNTADTSALSTATPGNWIESGPPNLANLQFYVYAYNNSGSTFSLMYSSADPVYSDTSDNTGGALRYYKVGSTYYRALAWISADPSGTIQTYNMGQLADGGVVNQISYTKTSIVTGTSVMALDDSIPQITEGTEVFAVPFCPTKSTNRIKISVTAFLTIAGTSDSHTMALFTGTTANALCSTGLYSPASAGKPFTMKLDHEMDAGTTSPIIFRVRIGDSDGSAMTFNVAAGARLYGGVAGSNITITEIEG